MSDRPPTCDRDPVFVHSRREAIVLLVAFSIFLVWVITASWLLGYGHGPETPLRTVWGVPHWVFWGVGLPWFTANVFTFGFCLFFVANDPLGQAVDEKQLAAIHNNEDEA